MSGESEIIKIYSLYGSRLSNHSIRPEKAIKKIVIIIMRYYERAPRTAPNMPYLHTRMQMSLSKSHIVFPAPMSAYHVHRPQQTSFYRGTHHNMAGRGTWKLFRTIHISIHLIWLWCILPAATI